MILFVKFYFQPTALLAYLGVMNNLFIRGSDKLIGDQSQIAKVIGQLRLLSMLRVTV